MSRNDDMTNSRLTASQLGRSGDLPVTHERRSPRVTGRIGWPLLRVVACVAVLIGLAAEFHRDFRTKSLAGFGKTGPNAAAYLAQTPEGLWVRLPTGHAKLPAVGLINRQLLQGDFEIVLSYEEFEAEIPMSGNGAGVSLYVTFDSPQNDAATISLLRYPKGQDIWAAHRAMTVNGKRKHHSEVHLAEGDYRSGQLALIRKGGVLSYLQAVGNDELQRIHEEEIGTADVSSIRLAADAGGSPAAVKVRFTDLQFRADSFSPLQSGGSNRSRTWLVAGLAAVILAAGVGAWRWFTRSRKGPPDLGPER